MQEYVDDLELGNIIYKEWDLGLHKENKIITVEVT